MHNKRGCIFLKRQAPESERIKNPNSLCASSDDPNLREPALPDSENNL